MLQQQLKEGSRDKNSQSTAIYVWNSTESVLRVTHKARNYFSFIGNIHRSSQVACVQTSPISFDTDDCFEKCN